jgi:uncharacterized protein YpmS
MNKWKAAFLILAGAVVLFILIACSVLVYLLTGDGARLPDFEAQDRDAQPTLTVSTTKHDLNQLVAMYVDQENEEQSGPFEYEVFVQDDVQLTAKVEVFAAVVPLNMTFQPEVLPNGDLLLHQRSFDIANMNVPVDTALLVLSHSIHFPEWVTIYPDDESIHVALTELHADEHYEVHAKAFNLEEDDIRFDIIFTDNPSYDEL